MQGLIVVGMSHSRVRREQVGMGGGFGKERTEKISYGTEPKYFCCREKFVRVARLIMDQVIKRENIGVSRGKNK